MILPPLTHVITKHFEIPTRDGRTNLTGQIDLPIGGDAALHPVVLMVNGGWFLERDGYMGSSGTERDLIYHDLASDFLALGLAVVRYDNRGVRCNEMTMPLCPAGNGEPEFSKHYLQACVDADVRQTVSVQTQTDDVEDVWNFTVNHPGVQSKRVIVWAHSEGGLNVARLISAKRICPLGVIIVCSAMESPVGLVRWQMVDRYAEHLMGWDADGDGTVTQADVDRRYPAEHLFAAVEISHAILTPPGEGWRLETARDHFSIIYEKTRTAALVKPDDAPYPDQRAEFRMVASSNNWWKQWFEDTRPMIDHFSEYRGHVSIHIGEIDSQSPGTRQFAFAESRIRAGIFARAPRLVLHKGRGHSLRTGEPAAGPMDDEAKACLRKEIKGMLAAR
jgi:pimeloyl-ACP methyl ester carboxylesterase